MARITYSADNTLVSYEWDSYEDFQPDMERVIKERPSMYKATVNAGGGERWFGCADGFAGVQRRIVQGWPELLEKLEQMLKDVELALPVFPSKVTERRRKRKYDDHGDELRMQEVWNGNLDTAWVRPAHTERSVVNTRRITLAFDVTANAWVTNEMAMWRAALCVLMCNSLAKAGRTFEIWIIDSSRAAFEDQRHLGLCTAWCAKQAHDPLVLDRLCAMVSVGFMRSSGFLAMGAGKHKVSPSFGMAAKFLPHTLSERRKEGETVIRIGECYRKDQCIAEYSRAWKEVEDAAQAYAAA